MSAVILVVDDDDAVRDVVRRILEQEGHTVLEATDGAQALYICDAFGSPPDLIISDVMMPEVTGGDLVRELNREGRTPRVIIMSGYADDVVKKSLDIASYPFLQKPFTSEELTRMVREALEH